MNKRKTMSLISASAIGALMCGTLGASTALADTNEGRTTIEKKGVAASYLVANDKETIEWINKQKASPSLPTAYSLNNPGALGDNPNALFCAADNGRTSPAEVNVTYDKPTLAEEWQGSTFDKGTKKAVAGKKFAKDSQEYRALAYLHSVAYLPSNLTSSGLQTIKTAQEVISGVIEEGSPTSEYYKAHKDTVDKVVSLAKEQAGPYRLVPKGEVKTEKWANGETHITIPGFSVKTKDGKDLNVEGVAKIVDPNFKGVGIQAVRGTVTLPKGMVFDNVPVQPGVDKQSYAFDYLKSGEDEISISMTEDICAGGKAAGIEVSLEGLPSAENYVMKPKETPESNPDVFAGMTSLSGAQTLAVLGLTQPLKTALPVCETPIQVGTVAHWDGNKKVIKLKELGEAKEIKLIDRVNLTGKPTIPAGEYVFSGEVYKVEKGKTVGEAIAKAGERLVTNEKESNFVDMTFTIPVEKLEEGASYVVFETVADKEGKVIGEHKDPLDDGQTVRITDGDKPAIHTTANWELTPQDKAGDKEGEAKTESRVEKSLTCTDEIKDKIGLVDTIHYQNLEPGKKYTVVGTLVNGKGEVVEDITQVEKEFTAKEAHGDFVVHFTTDKKLGAGKYVFFEEVRDENGKTIAEHKDINDESQTVTVQPCVAPSLGTTATWGNGEKTLTELDKDAKEYTIIDTIALDGYKDGTYTFTGEVWAVKNGKVQGDKAITTATLTVNVKNNEDVKMEFKIPADKVKNGSEFVVFETMKDASGKVVGEHKDPTDKGQTVNVKTTPLASTGAIAGLVITGAGVLMLAGAGLVLARKRLV